MEAPEVPDYFETPTTRRLQSLLSWAQRGRIVAAATGPGCGKTKGAKNYRDAMSNVWMVTIAPSCSGVNNMQIEVLAALGERDARGTGQALSRRIRDRIRNTGGLLLFDEAQHLSERSIEEIRSWHDDTGVGVAFFGNETVLARIEGGHRRAAFAQLYSRIGMRLIQNLPLADDARALADAWEVHDDKQVAFLIKKSQQPGGLRTVTMMLELATMVAAASGAIASSPTFRTRGRSSSRVRWQREVADAEKCSDRLDHPSQSSGR
jgi:DNA transposition AAA+ family ATPase